MNKDCKTCGGTGQIVTEEKFGYECDGNTLVNSCPDCNNFNEDLLAEEDKKVPWGKYPENMSFFEFQAFAEYDSVEEKYIEEFKDFFNDMCQSVVKFDRHIGDCTHVPAPCNLCMIEITFQCYWDYCKAKGLVGKYVIF